MLNFFFLIVSTQFLFCAILPIYISIVSSTLPVGNFGSCAPFLDSRNPLRRQFRLRTHKYTTKCRSCTFSEILY
jgi:hypothetical protein